MAGNSSFNVAFSLGGNALTNIKTVSLSIAGTVITSDVAAQNFMKHYAGSADATVTMTGEVAQTDVTMFGTNYAYGTTGAVEMHPFGDTATYMEYTSTNGTVTNIDISPAHNAVCAYTLTVKIDDLSLAAAT